MLVAQMIKKDATSVIWNNGVGLSYATQAKSFILFYTFFNHWKDYSPSCLWEFRNADCLGDTFSPNEILLNIEQIILQTFSRLFFLNIHVPTKDFVLLINEVLLIKLYRIYFTDRNNGKVGTFYAHAIFNDTVQ